jgi:hypothetical protein
MTTSNSNPRDAVLGVIILVLLLAGVIYLLRFGLPWIMNGVTQWWIWLSGYFK